MPPVKSTFLARRACTINFGAVAHSPRQPPWPCNIDHLSRGETAPWPAHAYNRISAPHAFGPQTRPGNSLHSRRARNGTLNSGYKCTTLRRATDRSPIKMHQLERYTGPEWHDQHAYNRSSALHMDTCPCVDRSSALHMDMCLNNTHRSIIDLV